MSFRIIRVNSIFSLDFYHFFAQNDDNTRQYSRLFGGKKVMPDPFYSIYVHGFLRAAVAIPSVRVADCRYNSEHMLALARRASDMHAAVTLFPELGISAYSNEDLFHQDALLDAACSALSSLVAASRDLSPVLIVGAPLRFEGKLFNCACVISTIDARPRL